MQVIMSMFINGYEVSTTMTISESKVSASRFMTNKMVKLDVGLEGTNKDLIAKCERISKLTNDMFKLLSEVDVN